MSSLGFIRLSRRFFENPYWEQERVFSFSEAWLDLIQMARYEEEPTQILLPNGREIEIKRGELRASLRYLSTRWKWSLDKTKTFINKHISYGDLIRKTVQGESILTLCNYDKYNSLSNCNQYTDQYTDRTQDYTEDPQNAVHKSVRKTAHQKQALKDCNSDSYNIKGSDCQYTDQYSDQYSDQYTDRTPTSTNNKKVKKEKEYNNIPPIIPQRGSGYESFDLSFLNENFRDIFLEWLDYKKDRKEKYRTQKSIETCYNQLLKKSGYSPEIATEIVRQSIGNNWAGLFELKTTGYENRQVTAKYESDERKKRIASKIIQAQREWELNNSEQDV